MVDVRPYSEALFACAQSDSQQESFGETLSQLCTIWQNNPELVQLLAHPKVLKEEKKKILRASFEKELDSTMMRFLEVCVAHNVAAYMPDIFDAYIQIYNEAHNIEIIKVESATELDEKQQRELRDLLSKKLDKKVTLQIKVDPSLIAGLRVYTEKFVLDNTVLSKAETMKEKMMKQSLSN